MITIIGLISYQQRFAISYVYAYQDATGDPFYSLALEYPETQQYYGLLAGVVLNLPYCIVGLFAGALTDRVKDVRQRAILFSVISIGWSLAVFGSGYIDAFSAFVIGRAL